MGRVHGSFRFTLPDKMSAGNTTAAAKEPIQSVQVFGRKKTATAVAYCKRGHGLIKVNGRPLSIIEPRLLQYKLYEPILLLGKDRFAGVDIRIKVKGGVTSHRCTPSDKRLPNRWSLTTRNMSMKLPSRRSRISSSTLIAVCCRSPSLRGQEVRWSRCP